MVKLKGPGMARDASGSLAETVIFSNWKGKSYLKLHQKPKQPRTQKQLAMRAIVNFITKIWKSLPAADPTSWTPLAAELNVSNINACLAYNLERWRGFHYPATLFPGNEVLPCQTWNQWNITGDIRHANHFLQGLIPNDGRGWAIHRGTAAGFPRAWDTLLHILPYFSGLTDYNWTDHLDPGTYWYRGVRISSDGRWQTEFLRGPIVVTP